MEMAMRELKEIKRKQTIGEKWNSAFIFSVMWTVYCVCLLIYLAVDGVYCSTWLVYFFLRAILLGPTYFIAHLWRIGQWKAAWVEPEWVGVIIASYIAAVSTLSFTAYLNETCGRANDIDALTVFVELASESVRMELKNGKCNGYSGTGCDDGGSHATCAVDEGPCGYELVDRRTFFEAHVFAWVGQLMLFLFAFTSLFKPSFLATMVYTLNTGAIGFLGCLYQGLDFWEDSERVESSGIVSAIFLWGSAALVNVYSAHVLHNMERDLVSANYELTANMEKRQRQPAGNQVVYLETDLQSSTKLWEHHTEAMHKAIKVHHNLMRSLALEYFGWELATEGDAFLLAFHDVFDAVSFALTFQHELMEHEWPASLLGDEDAAVEFALVSPEERDTLDLVKRGQALVKKPTPNQTTQGGGGGGNGPGGGGPGGGGPGGGTGGGTGGGGIEVLAFQGPRVRMAIHMGSSEGGIKGPTCRFVHHLTDLSWGGMVLLSAPVVNCLFPVLDQLAKAAQTPKEEVLVPKLVSMGAHSFEEYASPMEMAHIFNEPLRGRHLKWDSEGLQLRDSTQHSLGFYDSCVRREGLACDAAVVFAQVEDLATLQRACPQALEEGVRIVHGVLGGLLLKHRGTSVVPQREGTFLWVFQEPTTVAAFHRELQAALLRVKWPKALLEVPCSAPHYADPKALALLLFNGLTLSLGMSVGPVVKSLEHGRAAFQGPTCNRAARVASVAACGQLVMFAHEFQQHKAAFDQAEPVAITAGLLLEGVALKGVKGTPDVVWLDTDNLTAKRMEKGKVEGMSPRGAIGAAF